MLPLWVEPLGGDWARNSARRADLATKIMKSTKMKTDKRASSRYCLLAFVCWLSLGRDCWEAGPKSEPQTVVELVDKASLPMSDAEILWNPVVGVTCVLFSDGRMAMFTEDTEATDTDECVNVFWDGRPSGGPSFSGRARSKNTMHLRASANTRLMSGSARQNGTLRGTPAR